MVLGLRTIGLKDFLEVNFLNLLVPIRLMIKNINIVVLLDKVEGIPMFSHIFINEAALIYFLFLQASLDEIISFFYLFLKIIKHTIFGRHYLLNPLLLPHGG